MIMLDLITLIKILMTELATRQPMIKIHNNAKTSLDSKVRCVMSIIRIIVEK